MTSTLSPLGLGLATSGRTMRGRRKLSVVNPKAVCSVPEMSLSSAPLGEKRRKGPQHSQGEASTLDGQDRFTLAVIVKVRSCSK